MIEVQSLTRRYGKTTAVDDVSFSIGEREIVGLLGHNGAGKTTIMRMLSGYLEPSAGSIHIGGNDLATAAHAVQGQLGYLPEHLPVYPEMMVADYLEYAANLKGIPARERYPAVRQAVAATDLGERALDPINTLSRGFRQRVGVAQAILGAPRLLILDEPTNGLDPQQAEHMRSLVKRLAQRATVILSSHIMQEVEAICDRVLMLRHGRLALDRDLRELHHTRTLLLRTDAAVNELETYLRRMPQVDSVEGREGDNGQRLYTVQLHANADPDTAASNIARCVTEAGARLYQMRTAVTDLGSLFREVNDNND